MEHKSESSGLNQEKLFRLIKTSENDEMNFAVIQRIQRLRVEYKLQDADSIIKEWIV